MEENLKAFLDTISFSEGTDLGELSYQVMFGGTKNKPNIFHGFDDHPRKINKAGGFSSSAAGRYQFMPKTWDELSKKLHLKDFGPGNQDLACIQKLKERGAYDLILKGEFEKAILKCNREWASFPESPYSQPTHTMKELKDYYIKQGGKLLTT